MPDLDVGDRDRREDLVEEGSSEGEGGSSHPQSELIGREEIWDMYRAHTYTNRRDDENIGNPLVIAAMRRAEAREK